MKYLVMDMYNAGFFPPCVLAQHNDDFDVSFKVYESVREYKKNMENNGIRTCPLVFFHSLSDEELKIWLELTEKMYVTFLT